MKGKKNCGFNLIELMILIAIIGLLGNIAIPVLHKHMNNGELLSEGSDHPVTQQQSRPPSSGD